MLQAFRLKTRRNKAGWHRLMAVCLALLFMLSPAGYVHAERKNVRVGYSSSGSMLYRNDEGDYRGYDVIYLYEIAKYTNWDFTFVPYDKWNEAVRDLELGKLDLLPTVLKTPAREKTLLFPLHPMASTNVALVAPKNDTKYTYGDISGFQNAVIGVRENTVDTSAFIKWAASRGLNYQMKVYPDRGPLIRALDQGEVDLIATSYSGSVQQYPVVAEFSPQPMYFAVAPGRTDLVAEMDAAVNQSMLYDPSFNDRLMTLANPYRSANRLRFSQEEQEYIDQAPVLRVAMMRDGAPFSYEEDGVMKGVLPQLLQDVGQSTGLSFSIVPVDTIDEAFDAVRTGRADIVGRIAVDPYYVRELGLRATTPYYQEKTMQIARIGREIQKAGILPGSREQLVHNDNVPGKLAYETYDSVSECLKALEKGDVDAVFCDMATATYFGNVLHRREFQLNIIDSSIYGLAFGLDRDADPRLGRILDRTLQEIVPLKMPQLLQNTYEHVPISAANIFDRLSALQLTGIFLLLLLALLFFGYASFNLWRKRGMEFRVAEVEQSRRQASMQLNIECHANQARKGFYQYLDSSLAQPLKQIMKKSLEHDGLSPDSEYHEFYQLASRIQEFMLDVRMLNQIEGSKPSLNWETLACREFIEGLCHTVSEAAERKGVTFATDFSGIGDEMIIGERRSISIIIMWVLSYLMNYTPSGGTLLFSGSISQAYAGRSVLMLSVQAPSVQISDELLRHVHQILESAQSEDASIYDSFSDSDWGSLEERKILLRVAILQHIISELGGDWSIQQLGSRGTRIGIELYFDLA